MDKQKEFELKISVTTTLASKESAQDGPRTLVVFAGQKDDSSKDKSSTKEKSEKGAPKSFASFKSHKLVDQSLVEKFVEIANFAGKSGEFFLARNFDGELNNLVLVGLGSKRKITHETIRRAAGSLHTCLKRNELAHVTVDFVSISTHFKDASLAGRALAEGLVLGSYIFTDFKSEMKKKEFEDKRSPKTIDLLVAGKSEERAVESGVDLGTTIANCTNFAKWLGDNPANILTPTHMAEVTQKAAKGSALKVTVWDKARIKKEKMGCFLGVSEGSSEEPRLIVMEYKGAAASKKPLCYVGKGLTFDSGGISIKPSAGMEEMKFDMCGGSAVIATMLAISRLKLKVNAIGIVAASENMPGPSATKPGDIHIARNGKSVEINNTDAEGRLVLADALTYASELEPEFIVDAATLTGAMKMALGDMHTGYFCRDSEFNRKIRKAYEASGESLWEMPMTEDHLRDMRGTYADLSNISSIGGAGSAKGAAFLSEFVEKSIPWAHFDIAGTAWHIGHRVPYCPDKGASGVIVRTFVELARLHK